MLRISAVDGQLGLESRAQVGTIIATVQDHPLAYKSLSSMCMRAPRSDQNIVFNVTPNP